MKLPPEVMSRLKAVQDGTFIPVPPPPEQLTAEEEKQVALEARRQEKRQRAADKRLGLREHIRDDDLDVAIRIAARRREREVFYTMDSKAFEQFVQRRLAPELREGAPQPASWDGSPEEWESLRQQAEDVEREKLAAEFAAGIALRGLTPEEIASGTLNDGSEIREVEEYLARNGAEVPEALREGGPVPKTWPHGEEAWQALAAKAREHLGLRPMFDFAYGVAVQGHYTDELASGQLRPGARTNAATGAVVRPPEPTIPQATEDRARDALKALATRSLKIDAVFQQNLELAAYGRYTSNPRGAEAAVSAAESGVWQHEAQRQAAAKEEANRPWLVVHFAFRGPGGRSFTVGRQQVEPALADELREWQETMEAQAKQRGWDAPSGYNPRNWPPVFNRGGGRLVSTIHHLRRRGRGLERPPHLAPTGHYTNCTSELGHRDTRACVLQLVRGYNCPWGKGASYRGHQRTQAGGQSPNH